MKDIVVLGPGCPNCERLAADAEAAARSLGLKYQLYRITDPNSFAAFGVKATPTLVVDNRVVVSGRVASLEEIKALLGSEPA